MANTIRVCYAVMDLDGPKISATKLRGYLGHVFADTPEFHHHMEKPYHYPLVQYKRIYDGKYMVMGLAAYADILYNKIKDIECIVTKNEKLPIRTLEISKRNISVQNTHATTYQFNSLWIALNKQNYAKYNTLQHKKTFLQDILVGNILSAYRGLDVNIDFPLMADILWFNAKNAIAHENNFIGFRCAFRINISLIPFMGLGKSVSKGFGMINKIDT